VAYVPPFGEKQFGITSGSFSGYFYDQIGTEFRRGRNYGRLPLIWVSADSSSRAFGVYCPQIPLKNDDVVSDTSETTDNVFSGCGYYERTAYNNYNTGSAFYSNTNGWGCVMRTPTLGPEPSRYKVFMMHDTFNGVLASMNAVHEQTKVLKPTVFDWKYCRDNIQGLVHLSEDQIRLWWLTRGCNQGIRGKAGTSLAKPGGTAWSDYWRSY
jgi:hypothetical protein